MRVAQVRFIIMPTAVGASLVDLRPAFIGADSEARDLHLSVPPTPSQPSVGGIDYSVRP